MQSLLTSSRIAAVTAFALLFGLWPVAAKAQSQPQALHWQNDCPSVCTLDAGVHAAPQRSLAGQPITSKVHIRPICTTLPHPVHVAIVVDIDESMTLNDVSEIKKSLNHLVRRMHLSRMLHIRVAIIIASDPPTGLRPAHKPNEPGPSCHQWDRSRFESRSRVGHTRSTKTLEKPPTRLHKGQAF